VLAAAALNSDRTGGRGAVCSRSTIRDAQMVDEAKGKSATLRARLTAVVSSR
jgi:hypothetical protein